MIDACAWAKSSGKGIGIREYTMTEPTKTTVDRASPVSTPQKAILLSQRSQAGRGGFRGLPVFVVVADVLVGG
jgi:hypothetical protein